VTADAEAEVQILVEYLAGVFALGAIRQVFRDEFFVSERATNDPAERVRAIGDRPCGKFCVHVLRHLFQGVGHAANLLIGFV